MTAKRLLSTIGMLTLMALCCGPTLSAASPANLETLPTRRVGPQDYQSFVGNWDDKAHPVLYASIQTPAQWNAVMHPAAVMGKHPPFAPAAGEFAKSQLLLAARVMTAPIPDLSKCYTVEGATFKDGELTLSYRFNAPQNKATYTIKNYLAVWVPKRPAKKIVFVENGKPIGTLNVAGGQWSVPKLP